MPVMLPETCGLKNNASWMAPFSINYKGMQRILFQNILNCTNRIHQSWTAPKYSYEFHRYSDSKVHRAHLGPTWVLSAPGRSMLAAWTLLSGYRRSSKHILNQANLFTTTQTPKTLPTDYQGCIHQLNEALEHSRPHFLSNKDTFAPIWKLRYLSVTKCGLTLNISIASGNNEMLTSEPEYDKTNIGGLFY